MKSTVIKPFADAENLMDTYAEGDEFAGSEKRVRELAARGFVKPHEGKKRTTGEEPGE